MFHCNDIEALMKTDSVVNAAFEVQIDEWKNRRSVKAMRRAVAGAHVRRLEACLNPENLSFVSDLYATRDEELCADAPHDPEAIEEYENELEVNRAHWEAMARQDPQGLLRGIVRAIIGDGQLHQAQRDILDNLAEGKSVLGVMVTGRGKSLTFQVHATLRARWRPARPACSCTRCAPSSPTRRSICARRWRPSASPWSRLPASPRSTSAARRSRAWPTAAWTSR